MSAWLIKDVVQMLYTNNSDFDWKHCLFWGGLVFSGAVIGGGLGIWLLIELLTPPLTLIGQPYVTAVEAHRLSIEEQSDLLTLIKLGVVTTTSAVVAQITSFYSTAIGVILAAAGLLNLIGFLYLKLKAEEELDRRIRDQIDRIIQQTSFQKVLNDSVKGELKAPLDDIEQRVGEVEESIRNVEKMVSENADDREN